MFARSSYQIAADHPLVLALQAAVRASAPSEASPSAPSAASPSASSAPSAAVTGMSFWTDASVLGDAGIPSLLYGPVGAGLHSVEEWVDADSVLACRDALVGLARTWCRQN
jgi:acetylornithine deacetylase